MSSGLIPIRQQPLTGNLVLPNDQEFWGKVDATSASPA